MIGILYFSSTGNSLQIAKAVQAQFGGKILYIPNYSGNGSEFERIFLVSPIYSFGVPTPVFNLLPKLSTTPQIIAILNYGGMVGGADALLYKYAKQYKLNLASIYTLKMPENYTLTFTVPKFYLTSVLKSSYKRINEVIDKIKNNQFSLPHSKKTKEQTYLKNKGNWHIIGQRFKSSPACIKCQKCVKLCPVGNISFKDGQIVFGDKCIACLGCYHRCPQKAIKYLNKNKKFRYINPNINESDIGKDF